MSEVRAMHDSMARIVPDNPLAFPPSMAVRRRTTARMQEVEQRREHDYTDVGVRVAPGAATELPKPLPVGARGAGRTTNRTVFSF